MSKMQKLFLDPNVKLDGVKSGIGLDKAIVDPKIKDGMTEVEKAAKRSGRSD